MHALHDITTFSEFCLALYDWMSDKKYEVHTEILKRKGGVGGIGGWSEEGGGLRWNSTNRKLLDRGESKDGRQEASKETGRGRQEDRKPARRQEEEQAERQEAR